MTKKESNKKLNSFAVWTGLEPATPCVTGRYSNQLNYHTIVALSIDSVSLSIAMQRYNLFLDCPNFFVFFL